MIARDDRPIPANLLDYESELLDKISKITANVLKMMIAHRFTRVGDVEGETAKALTCESTLLRSLQSVHHKYQIAAGYEYYQALDKARRLAQIDYDHIVARAQIIASNHASLGLELKDWEAK